MAKATYNGTVLAESDDFEVVEGNIYFPPSSVKTEYFSDSELHTVCPWKGTANYFNIAIDGDELKDAAWTYPDTRDAAKKIENYVAFYRNKVQVER